MLQLYFRAPKAGTGPISFRTLIKRGVANTGTSTRLRTDQRSAPGLLCVVRVRSCVRMTTAPFTLLINSATRATSAHMLHHLHCITYAAPRTTQRRQLQRHYLLVGYFHYPLYDLLLDEYEYVPPDSPQEQEQEGRHITGRSGRPFSLANATNVDCNTHCNLRGQQCDGGALAAAEGANMFAKMVAPYHVCTKNPKLSCSSVAPAVEPGTGHCYFRGNATAAECLGMVMSMGGQEGNLSQGGAPQGDVCTDRPGQLCAASAPGVQRLCACTFQTTGGGRRHREESDVGAGAGAAAAPAALAPAPAPVSTPLASSAAAPPPRSSVAASVAAAAVATTLIGSDSMHGGGGGGHLRVWTATAAFSVATMALAAFPAPAHAHNWMMTPGRAMFEASTTKPCRGRKATDVHAQVGPGQCR